MITVSSPSWTKKTLTRVIALERILLIMVMSLHFSYVAIARQSGPISTSPTLWRLPQTLPEKFNFYPSRGPIAGGTELTIFTYDVGAENQEEYSVINVTVAGIPCDISMRGSEKLKCSTRPTHSKNVSGTIVIFVRNASEVIGSVESSREFFYLESSLESIRHIYGPEGSRVWYIKGKNLDIGSKRNVVINNVPCVERKKNNGSTLSCITRKSNFLHPFQVSVLIDAVELIFVDMPEPVTYDFKPRATTSSGGTAVAARGRHLVSFSGTKIVVTFSSRVTKEQVEVTTSCNIFNNGQSRVACKVLGLPSDPSAAFLRLRENDTFEALDSFELDGAHARVAELKVTYYADRDFSQFNDSKTLDMSEAPTIELNRTNVHHSDVKVLVGGNRTCVVQPQSVYKLSCKLDLNGSELSVGELLNVQVFMGNLKFELGYATLAHKPPYKPPPSGTSTTTAIILASVFVTLALVAIVVFFVMRRRDFARKRPSSLSVRHTSALSSSDKTAIPQSNEDDQESGIDPTTILLIGARGPYVMDDETLAILAEEHKLIAYDCLTLGETVGKGHFGCVYKASLRLPGTEECTQVAVKTLLSSWLSPREIEMFISEALVMKDFDHEHVLHLIGVSFSPANGSPLVIIPFMPNGDLHKFIRDVHIQPSNKQLITFGLEIAKGMDYLATQKFVHRDLAARNCMLDSNLCVKVADFGLSRDIYESAYYKSKSMTELPVKWIAPESLDQSAFDMKSDVWAFGVTLWEVMTRGASPYHLVANWQMLEYLKLGNRLPQPGHCPDILYSIMKSCWSSSPNDRPTFKKIVTGIQDAIVQLKEEAMQRRITLNITYVNVPSAISS